MLNNLSLLAVFAHPDDESCGPGATLATYARRGVEVSLVCMTRGERGAWGADQSIPSEQFAMTRVQELGCACRALGITRWTALGYPDGRLAECGRRELEARLVWWMRALRPHVVIANYPEGPRGHPDHDTLAWITTKAYLKAGAAACFPEDSARGLQPWQPLKLYYALPADAALVSRPLGRCAVIGADAASVEAKVQALQCHATQGGCWRPLLEEMRQRPRWEESFCLAHSTVGLQSNPEEDLFSSVQVSV